MADTVNTQSYGMMLMNASIIGGGAGGLAFAWMNGMSGGGYAKALLFGAAGGFVLSYVNNNLLGTPGTSSGPIPSAGLPMGVASAVAGYGLNYGVAGRV